MKAVFQKIQKWAQTKIVLHRVDRLLRLWASAMEDIRALPFDKAMIQVAKYRELAEKMNKEGLQGEFRASFLLLLERTEMEVRFKNHVEQRKMEPLHDILHIGSLYEEIRELEEQEADHLHAIAKLQGENNELKAELAQLNKNAETEIAELHKERYVTNDVLNSEILQLRSQVSQLRQDKLRLDSLSEFTDRVPYFDGSVWRMPYLMLGTGGYGGGVAEFKGNSIREVIDTAISYRKTHG